MDLVYEFELGKDGYTKNAFLIDTAKTKTRLRIAGPGEFGYISEPKTMKLERPEFVSTPAGDFEVNEVLVYSAKNQVAGMADMTSVFFINDKVPFGLVMNKNTTSIRLPLSDLLDFISMVSPLNATYKTLATYLFSFGENSIVEAGSHVIEYGKN